MFRDIVIFFIFIIIFSFFMAIMGMEPEFRKGVWGIPMNYMYFLFLPIIPFLILRFLSEKTKDDKLAMKYAIASLILAILSWLGFFVYNNYFL